MPPAVPVLAAIGSAAVGSSAAAGMSTAALATVGGISAASAVGGIASGIKGIVDMTKGDGSSVTPFNQEKANRKAALQAASGARKRIAQQTTTLLTSPLGGLGGVGKAAGGVAKTLLGM